MSHYGTELVQNGTHTALRKRLLADQEKTGERWAKDQGLEDVSPAVQLSGLSQASRITDTGSTAIIRLMMKKYDKNNDGRLCKTEMKHLMKDVAQGMEPSDEEVEVLLTQCDINQDGFIDMKELSEVMTQWMISVQKKKSVGGTCNCIIS